MLDGINTLGTYKLSVILMFVCLLKDRKQCCDATKHSCTPCAGHRLVVTELGWSMTCTMNMIELRGTTALFGISIQTNIKFQEPKVLPSAFFGASACHK